VVPVSARNLVVFSFTAQAAEPCQRREPGDIPLHPHPAGAGGGRFERLLL